MKHIKLLNPGNVLDTYNNQCENNDSCYVCDVDCSCDTYVCVDVCVIDGDGCIANVECNTCNIAVNVFCGFDIC